MYLEHLAVGEIAHDGGGSEEELEMMGRQELSRAQ